VSIVDDIAREAERLNALDKALDVAGVLMHPETADKVCAWLGGRTMAEHYQLCYPDGVEIMRDPTCPVGLALPQSRSQLVAWKERHS
jgi:hypothetical protein